MRSSRHLSRDGDSAENGSGFRRAPTLQPAPERRPILASIVIPLHNEQSTLETLYIGIRDVCERSDIRFEVIFVDDGSSDGSPEVLTSLALLDRRIRPVILRRNFGKAAALATGFRAAQGRYVVTMDADLQDDPEEIPRLLEKLSEGYGLVSGWKQERHDPFTRRVASKIFNFATRRLSHVKLHDFNCGLKAYTRECAQEVAEHCYGELHRYLPVFAHYRGFAVTELPVRHRKREAGRSRYGVERYLRGFFDLFTAVFMSRYARRPMHVFGAIGMLLFIPGAFSLTWLVVMKVAFGDPIGGRPLLVLGAFLSIAGLQLILAGLLGELVAGARANAVPSNPVVVLHEAEWPPSEEEAPYAARSIASPEANGEAVPIRQVTIPDEGEAVPIRSVVVPEHEG